jgi:hypothetical protein
VVPGIMTFPAPARDAGRGSCPVDTTACQLAVRQGKQSAAVKQFRHAPATPARRRRIKLTAALPRPQAVGVDWNQAYKFWPLEEPIPPAAVKGAGQSAWNPSGSCAAG